MDIIRDTRPEKRKKKLAWSAAGISTLAIAVLGWQLLPTGAPTMDTAMRAARRVGPPPRRAVRALRGGAICGCAHFR